MYTLVLPRELTKLTVSSMCMLALNISSEWRDSTIWQRLYGNGCRVR